MLLEIIKFIIYSVLIVLISKYMLVRTLEKLADELNLKAKTAGNIAGFATSVPEFLTITTSSIKGLAGASVYNILSSNVINLLLFFFTILFNKNIKKLKNKALKIDIILVIITIIIPIILLRFDKLLTTSIIPIFIILYLFFLFLNNNAHNLYIDEGNNKKIIEIQNKNEQKKRSDFWNIFKNVIILLITGFLLFVIGELLGDSLNILCRLFNVPQVLIGILLGFITSLPEMITFIEEQKHSKKQDDMTGIVEATNNLLSSNVLNLFIIQAVGILIINIKI